MNKIQLLRIFVACLPPFSVPLLAQETISTIGTGEYATTYVTATGKVYTTVGNDTAGYSVVAIPGLSNIVQAEGGQYSSVLRGADGKVYSVNGGTTDVTAYPVDNTGAPFSADYVQGFYKNFLALKDGKLWYWSTPKTGRNSPADILNQGYSGTVPKKLNQPEEKTFIKVVSASPPAPGSETFVWALASDGSVWQWDRTRTAPVVVTGYTGTARDIAMVGPFAFVVETTDKQLWTWGYYALYTGGVELWRDSKPRNVTALWEAAGVVFPSKKLQGNYNTLHIIDANNNMFASGCNMQGNVGNGQQHPSWRTYPDPYRWSLKKEEGIVGPVQVPGKWKDVICNNTVVFYLYGQDMAGNWYSWGRNKSRALGNGLTMNSSDEATKSEYYNIPAPRLVTPLTQTWTVSGSVNVNAHRSPVASAGINQYLPAGTTSTTLYGNGSHQQQPTTTTTVTMNNAWTQIGGVACSIVSPSLQNTTVNNLAPGTYVFRNTVSNINGAIDSQLVTVVVGGPLLTITTPTTGATYATAAASVSVTGSCSPAVVQVAWTNSRGGNGIASGTASWSATIPLQVGENILTFTATDVSSNSEVRTLVVTSTPTPPASGNGLAATYYNEKNLTGSSLSRVDSQINFLWGSGSPDPAIAPDTFSARWEGRIQATVSGTYTFTVGSDDGSRLWIGETLVVDHWGDHGHTMRSGTMTLTAGQKYPIKMEYYENTAGASAELRWSPPSGTSVVVPSSALTPPPANGLVGTYYDTKEFLVPSFSRVDPTVSFYWGTGSPDPRIASETFSVIWQGKVLAGATGVYTFEIGSDDGTRLWVNDTLVATHWGDHGHTVRTGTIALTAGQAYPIRMEYYENTSGASAELKWIPPAGQKAVVPTTSLLAEVDEPASQSALAGGAPVLQSAVSRQAHGTAGSFDIDLAVSGAPSVECRQLASGSCTLVLTFDQPIAGGNATLVGVGSVTGSPVVSGNKMTVQLGAVADGQTMQLNVSGVGAQGGGSSGSASVMFRVLAGDANRDGIVTDADVDLVKSGLAPTINAGNAASDINRNGSLNTGDVLFVIGRRGGSAL